jgi:ubiquinone biosynthesis accessory factor UbiJ
MSQTPATNAVEPSAPLGQTPNGVARAKLMVLDLINAGLARLVALDPATTERLRALDGRTVVLQLSKPTLVVQVKLHDGRFRLESNKIDAAEADLNLKTTAGALMSMLANRITHGKDAMMPAGKLHISGDAELARQMQLISAQFDPDWDAPFTAIFGDVLGFQMARGAQKFAQWAKQSALHVAQSTSEYLREESKDTLAPGELDQFLEDVDQLRDAADRVELRFKRLMQKYAKPA